MEREERRVQVPARFEYEVAGSVGEAAELLERYGEGARLIAGGHSLIPMMKLRLAAPEVLVDISGLDSELRYIEEEGGALRIGALTRHREVLESPVIGERYALLADAERMIADPLVRNMGTIGGDLANADPAEDLPAAFVALDSEVLVRGPNGERILHIDDLYIGPFETSLEHSEVLTEIRVPRSPGGSAYSKVKRKTGDYAAAAIGVALSMGGQEGISLSIMAEISSLRAESRPSFSVTQERESPGEPDGAVDPVCGMAVEVASARHVVEHGGTRYYFCCSGCRRAFEQEPEKYAAQVSLR